MLQTIDSTAVLHPFERAGLGKAPFTLAGYHENWYSAAPDHRQPGGTCDYCANGIAHEFIIRSRDGREFKVGCDCVMKLGRTDNRLVSAVERHVKAIERAARKAKSDARKAKEQDRIAAALSRLDDPMVAERFAAMPHPSGFLDRRTGFPLSAANFIAWMRLNAGHAGMLGVANLIEKTLS